MRIERYFSYGFWSLVLFLATLSSAVAFEQLSHKTGLRAVYHLNLPDEDTVKLQLVFHVGDSDLSGPEGLAHYLEHLVVWHMVGGAVVAPSMHRFNAFTSNSVTAYWQDGPVEDAEALFAKLARVFETPDLPAAFMRRERDVVAREYDMRISEHPERRFHMHLSRVLYDNKPAGKSVIGTPASIRSLTVADALRQHAKFYVPANATLVIAGNIGRDEARQLVEKHFGSASAGEAAGRAWKADIPGGTERIEIRHADRQIKTGSVFVRKIVRMPGYSRHALVRVAARLSNLLSSPLPGSLTSSLRHDAAVVSTLRFGLNVVADEVFEVSFWARPETGVSLERVVEEYQAALSGLARGGLPEATVSRSIAWAARSAERQRHRLDARMAAASRRLANDMAPVSTSRSIDAITSLSKADFDRVLQAMVMPGRSVVGFITSEQN